MTLSLDKPRIHSIFLTIGLACAAASCSNGPQVTHHWVSPDTVPATAYQRDLTACSKHIGTNTKLKSDSAEFKAYTDCMSRRGYSLASSADVKRLGEDG